MATGPSANAALATLLVLCWHPWPNYAGVIASFALLLLPHVTSLLFLVLLMPIPYFLLPDALAVMYVLCCCAWLPYCPRWLCTCCRCCLLRLSLWYLPAGAEQAAATPGSSEHLTMAVAVSIMTSAPMLSSEHLAEAAAVSITAFPQLIVGAAICSSSSNQGTVVVPIVQAACERANAMPLPLGGITWILYSWTLAPKSFFPFPLLDKLSQFGGHYFLAFSLPMWQ